MPWDIWEDDLEEAQAWARTAEAVLERLGGHAVRPWNPNEFGTVLDLEGDNEWRFVLPGGTALKEKVLGRDASRRRTVRREPRDLS